MARQVLNTRMSAPAAAVICCTAALLAKVDAYFDPTNCTGGLCSAPWAREPPPVVRWADRPALCVAMMGNSHGELALKPCNSTGVLQIATLGASKGKLKLGDKCVAARNPSSAFSLEDCDSAEDRQEFELPESGSGAIRAVAADRCLALQGNITDAAHVLRLVDCAPPEVLKQTFLVPTAYDRSAFVGVNLGGWLIVEDWMWPAAMANQDIPDEYSLVKAHGGPNSSAAQDLMKNHWDTFLQEDHLDTVRRWGATHVRIPLGYWLLDAVYREEDGFVAGGEPYLQRALTWLKARGMFAVLDLHAMPGAQALDGFTGRRMEVENFFVDPGDFHRGEEAVKALTELVAKYEADLATAGVVVGVQLLNEPSYQYISDIFEFYEAMVREVRKTLPAEKYLIMLSFMDSPHTQSAEWLAARRDEDPGNFDAVIFDVHLYHVFNDNTAPWSPQQDYCKTCCRDRYILEPMASVNVPTIVGEYGLATGFNGWADDGFLAKTLANQLSLWNTTASIVGSFLWNFRIQPDPFHPQDFLEWSLVDQIAEGVIAPDFVYVAELGRICPEMGAQVPRACPDYSHVTVIFDTKCEWQEPAFLQGARRRPGHGGAFLSPGSK